MVLPVAIAGNTLQAIWLMGQFHGVIRPQTPMGSLTTRVLPCSSSNWNFFSASMAVARCPMPIWTCGPAARDAGAPISSLTASARSAERFWYSASTAPSSARRSSRVVCDQVVNALRAASTAASTSAAPPIAIRPETCSVVGLSTSRVLGSIGSTHWPLM